MTLDEILSRFPSQRALVVGDICLDRWCTYDPAEAEPSRETGIPRIAVTGAELTPGAGGTVANNLAALGAGQVAVLGIIGQDGHGFELKQALAARGISSELCVEEPSVATFTYTKLLNAVTCEEDKPRVDFINKRSMPAGAEQRAIANLRDAVAGFDVVLVSDQAETETGGVVTPAMRAAIDEIARQYPEKVVWVDSRLRPEHFRGVIVKPNEDEARAACRRAFGAEDYGQLWRRIAGPMLIVTHGGRGALIVREQESWVETKPVANPVDICGAGDSFSAGAAVAYAISRDAEAAVRFGNVVASITIMKKGTGTASPAEVRAKL